MTFSVRTGDKDGRAAHWFASFLSSNEWMDSDYDLQKVLDEVNAHARADGFFFIGDPLTFETEHDFTMFVLRWS